MVVKRVPLQASTSNLLALKLFADSNGDVIAHSGVKVGSFTRDVSLASGNQAVTGIGFRPVAVIFLLSSNANKEMSIGFDDGTNSGSLSDWSGVTANTYQNTYLYSLQALYSSGIYYQGKIASLDADGFTVIWTKTGSPTGTLNIHYIAFR